MARREKAGDIDAVRAFNRFYTGHVGALDESMLHSGFTLVEARLLYELDRQPGGSAGDLARRLRIDPAYLSRLLKRFRQAGLVAVRRDQEDARRQLLTLTEAGKQAFAPLEEGSRDRVTAMLTKLAEDDRRRLLAAMSTIRALLDETAQLEEPAILRPCRPGEAACLLDRAVSAFRREQGWAGSFEAEIAGLVAAFLSRSMAEREGLLVVERDEQILGGALLLDEGVRVTVPLFFLAPQVRGQGLGRHLLDQAMAQARAGGYRRIRVLSEAALRAAAGLLESSGFRLERERDFADYGRPLRRQSWERSL